MSENQPEQPEEPMLPEDDGEPAPEPQAPPVEETPMEPEHEGAPDKVEVFTDDADLWRWHRIAGNNRVISTSGEAFYDKYNAVRAAQRANPDTLAADADVRVYFENEDTPL